MRFAAIFRYTIKWTACIKTDPKGMRREGVAQGREKGCAAVNPVMYF